MEKNIARPCGSRVEAPSRETRQARRRAVQVLPFTTTMPPHRTARSRPADAAPVDVDSDHTADTENDEEPLKSCLSVLCLFPFVGQ